MMPQNDCIIMMRVDTKHKEFYHEAITHSSRILRGHLLGYCFVPIKF